MSKEETKVSVLNCTTGQHDEFVNTEGVEKIVFTGWLSGLGNISEGEIGFEPSDWENVVLLQKEWKHTGEDLIMVFDKSGQMVIMIGFWNDGIIK